jgi:CHAD domain-containing protein
MLLHTITYLLSDEFDLEQLKSVLAKISNTSLREDAPSHIKKTYYDSFDWRVWLAGAELAYEQGEYSQLCWRLLDNCHQPPLFQRMEQEPKFAQDLPSGPLTDRLAEVLEMRVLLSKVIVQQDWRNFALIDGEEKTVARIALVSNVYRSVNRKQTGSLESRLVVRPLKGYGTYFEKILEHLKPLQLQSCERSLYLDALSSVRVKAGDYSSKLNYSLDPEVRSDSTAKRIMLGLLDTLEANIAGTKANLDSEFLHDLRVATRRTRSAMSQIKGVFDPQELEPFKRGFGWIGQITGPTRDLDVYLLQYDGYRASLPEVIQNDLDPFHAFLVRHHKEAHDKLVRQLNAPHFRKLIKSWRIWLETPVQEQPVAGNATEATAQLADRGIAKLYRKVLRQGTAIDADTPAEYLHELRKECKKLRYLMEFFQSLYSKPEIRRLIKLVKIILDNLGEFQDLEVQAKSLETFGDMMLKEGAPASALMAMGILVGKLFDRQAQARREFHDLFSEFRREENQKAFRKLFGVA